MSCPTPPDVGVSPRRNPRRAQLNDNRSSISEGSTVPKSPPPGKRRSLSKSLTDSSGVMSPIRSPRSPGPKSPIPPGKRDSGVSPRNRASLFSISREKEHPHCLSNEDHSMKILTPGDVTALRCEDCQTLGAAAAGMRRRLYQCCDCVNGPIICKQCLSRRHLLLEEKTKRREIDGDNQQELDEMLQRVSRDRLRVADRIKAAKEWQQQLATTCATMSDLEDSTREEIFLDAKEEYEKITSKVDSIATTHQLSLRETVGYTNVVVGTSRSALPTIEFLEVLTTSLSLPHNSIVVRGLGELQLPREQDLKFLRDLAREKPQGVGRPIRDDTTPLPFSVSDLKKISQMETLASSVLSLWRLKPGSVVDELAENLIFPPEIGQIPHGNFTCHSPAKFAYIYTLAEGAKERCRSQFCKSKSSLLILVLVLYCCEGPDIDRLVGFSDAPQPRQQTSKSNNEWEAYQQKVGGTRNPSIREVIERSLHIMANLEDGDTEASEQVQESMLKWVKVLGGLLAAIDTTGTTMSNKLTHCSTGVSLGLVDEYKRGERLIGWPFPLSTSRNDNVLRTFAECTGDGICHVIHSAYDMITLSDVSLYPGEEEVLLPPFSIFSIDSSKEASAGLVVYASNCMAQQLNAMSGLQQVTSVFKKESIAEMGKASNILKQIVEGPSCELTIGIRQLNNRNKLDPAVAEKILRGGLQNSSHCLHERLLNNPILSVLCNDEVSCVARQRNASIVPSQLDRIPTSRELPPEMIPAIKLFTAIGEENCSEAYQTLKSGACDAYDKSLLKIYESSSLHLACALQSFECSDEGLFCIKTMATPCEKVMWYHKGEDPMDLISSCDASGQTPLHISVIYGHWKISRVLIGCGVSCLKTDRLCRTPLHIAAISEAFQRDDEALKVLDTLATDDTIDLPDENDLKRTALLKSVDKGFVATSRTLSLRCDINVVDSNGRNALHIAADLSNINMMSVLISQGISLDHLFDGKTCLEKCSSVEIFQKGKGNQVYKRLATRAATEWLHSTDSNGRTPLHRAAMAGRVVMVETLIDSGSPIDQQDNSGRCPLQAAIELGEGDREGVCTALLPISSLTLNKKCQEELRRIMGSSKAARRQSKPNPTTEAVEKRRARKSLSSMSSR